MSIVTSLKATGVADVIVVLKSASAKSAAMAGGKRAAAKRVSTKGAATSAAGIPANVLRHFVSSTLSQDGQLLEALTGGGLVRAVRTGGGATRVRATAASAPKARYYPNLGLALGTVDREGLAALRGERQVEDVVDAPQLRMIKPVARAETTVQPGFTWGLRALGIDALHAQGLTGKGVIVGHLDTGVDGAHPALAGVVKAFAEFDLLGNQVAGAVATDSGEHGTHTAGTIAGQRIKRVQFGVAPGAKLASAMVIEGGNVLARILGGMNWAVGQRARILSMSLGLPGAEDAFLAITRILRARGVLPAFAVGNEGPGTSRYPGNYAEALSVGAMDEAGNVADFSSSQRFKRKKDPLVPDLVAPGVDVVSCVPNGGFVMMSGSSMATPHVAGLAALLMEARPAKSIDQIEAAILQSCTRTPTMLASRANRGVPHGVKALSLL